MSSNNQTPSSVITIATWALAGTLAIIVVTLSIIVIRDDNTPLVSQAMGELLWLGGIAIATLVGLLGFTKYLENTPSNPAAAAPSAAPTNALGIAGDIGSFLSSLGASAPAAPAAPSSSADNTPTLTAIPVVSGGQ